MSLEFTSERFLPLMKKATTLPSLWMPPNLPVITWPSCSTKVAAGPFSNRLGTDDSADSSRRLARPGTNSITATSSGDQLYCLLSISRKTRSARWATSMPLKRWPFLSTTLTRGPAETAVTAKVRSRTATHAARRQDDIGHLLSRTDLSTTPLRVPPGVRPRPQAAALRLGAHRWRWSKSECERRGENESGTAAL